MLWWRFHVILPWFLIGLLSTRGIPYKCVHSAQLTRPSWGLRSLSGHMFALFQDIYSCASCPNMFSLSQTFTNHLCWDCALSHTQSITSATVLRQNCLFIHSHIKILLTIKQNPLPLKRHCLKHNLLKFVHHKVLKMENLFNQRLFINTENVN